MTDQMFVMLPAAVAVVAGGIMVMRRSPAMALAIWLTVIAFVPVWFGFTAVYFFLPASAVGIIVMLSLIRRDLGIFTIGDLIAFFFFAACLLPLVVGGTTFYASFTLITEWIVGYAIGRLVLRSLPLEKVASIIAVVFFIVAVIAVVEYFSHWHPFANIGPTNALTLDWQEIQIRGGQERIEVAMGHSIALGVSLALALPFVVVSRFRVWAKMLMIGVILAAIVFTFSRISLICAGLALLGTALLVKDQAARMMRTPVLLMLSGAAIIAIPMLLTVFAEAGKEATESGEYRGKLGVLIPQMNLIGYSDAAVRSPTGVLRFGGFRSIDNALLLGGLTYGGIAIFLAMILLVVGILALLSGRATAPLVAVMAHTPALVSVALITQYSMFFWFVVGLAVASMAHRVTRSVPPPSDLDDQPFSSVQFNERLRSAVQ